MITLLFVTFNCTCIVILHICRTDDALHISIKLNDRVLVIKSPNSYRTLCVCHFKAPE